MGREGREDRWTAVERGEEEKKERREERKGEMGWKRNNSVMCEEGEGVTSCRLRRGDMSWGFIIPSISALFMLDGSQVRGRIYSFL